MTLNIEQYLPSGPMKEVVRSIWKNDARSFNAIAKEALGSQFDIPGKLSIHCVSPKKRYYSFRRSINAGGKRENINAESDNKLATTDNHVFIHTDTLKIVIITRQEAEALCIDAGSRKIMIKNYEAKSI